MAAQARLSMCWIREILRLQAEGIASARSPAVWAVRARACRFACGGPSVQGSHQLAVPVAKYWSEWQDLNLRPPRPERGALPDYATIRRRMVKAGPKCSLSADRTRGRTMCWPTPEVTRYRPYGCDGRSARIKAAEPPATHFTICPQAIEIEYPYSGIFYS